MSLDGCDGGDENPNRHVVSMDAHEGLCGLKGEEPSIQHQHKLRLAVGVLQVRG